MLPPDETDGGILARAASLAMSFSNKILVGLAGGVLVGVFLGERAAALKWAADGFVKLLQMTVLPYVTVSIVGSLGRLAPEDAKTLGVRTGAVLAGLWLLALVFTFLIPLTFPDVENASFFSTTLVERRPPFNFVDLYIPSNPFYSLANNIVPAVVLFSVVLGMALIKVERKQVLLDVLTVAGDALSRATRLIVRLTPYGLFAIAATAAGTLSLEQLGRLQVFLVAYVLVALLVSFWVLPGLVAALTPIRMRDIFRLTRDALLTAFVAGDLFIVLPILLEASKRLIEQYAPQDPQAASLPDVIVPASFNFPHTGKLLSISFVLFAGWFTDAAVRIVDYPRLALSGLVSFFGSLNVAVPFLLDVFRIPADTFQLFIASGVINSRVGTLVAAVHTVTVALLGTYAAAGLLQWNRRRLVRYGVVTAILTLVAIGGTRIMFAHVLDQRYTKDKVLAGMHLLRAPVPSVVHRAAVVVPPDPAGATVLDAIRSRGRLRVGYLPDSLPFAFFNERDELVGFDVELAHGLARELAVTVEFVPIARNGFDEVVNSGGCDILMSGVVATTLRASRTLLSVPYLDETLAFLVPDNRRDSFSTWEGIRSMGAITIAVPAVPYYMDKLRAMLPQATLQPLADIRATLSSGAGGADAIALPAERGSAWTLIYPAYSVVVPEPGVYKIPLTFALAKHDQSFAAFVNTWIDLKRKDGTIDVLYRYWILGQETGARRPRWSVIRNVLHWVE
ncbi:MAG TPA: cation:dicarboxylase symporter family transporter [Vicinamibacterales bacterium]|nr:cation:dicarboxylase symporter family transporter [Vicinamibacterales bacterium]